MGINQIIARRIKQNNQDFLISIVKVSELRRLTKYTERIITEFDENNSPVYNLEIQRKSDRGKVKLIAEYLINDPQAMFPTNIVLAIPSFLIDSFTETETNIILALNEKVEEEISRENGDIYISVIDGQHRLKGIELAVDLIRAQIVELKAQDQLDRQAEKKLQNLSEKLNSLLNFDISVTFFIDPVLEYQASIFSTINRTQTKVSESLVYSLFGLTDKVSPQKTSLEVTLALNSFRSSPFYNRIKLVGWNYSRGQSPALTQAAMVKSLIRCISANVRESELDRFRPRKELLKGINPDLCFREYYARDQDVNITKVLFSYFTAVQQTFVDSENIAYWLTGPDRPDNILQTTVGFEALLQLLKDILRIINQRINAENLFEQIKFEPGTYIAYLAKATDIEFTNFDRYPRTSKTKKVLYEDLKLKVFAS